MKLTFDLIDCLPCMVRHTMEAAERAGADAVQREEIVRRTCSYMADMPFGQSPPEAARNIYRIIHDVTGCRDFYADAKRQYNRLLLDAYAELQGKVRKARDPFEAAARMAIGGNIIDFGSNAGLDEQSVFATLAEVESQPLALDELARLRAAIQRAGKVLYLADNAGEIVLDKLFISEFPPDTRVTVAVKGGPVLNDVTLEDALAVGMDERAQVISNGFDVPGTVLPKCSAEFRTCFDEADVVISKGQGNFETLAGCGRPDLFFMLKVKCSAVAKHLDVPVGSIVLFSEQQAP